MLDLFSKHCRIDHKKGRKPKPTGIDNMNVMAKAHKNVKEAIKFQVECGNGRTHTYAQMLSIALKIAHKEYKKANARFMVEFFISAGNYKTVDIRTLPVFSASGSSLPNELVQGWTIKGTLHTGESWVTEQTSGFSAQTLKQNLSHWSRYTYKQLCLMLEIDGVKYRLVK